MGDIDFCFWKFKKFQKTRFWKAKSVEDMVTLGPRATGHINIKSPPKAFDQLQHPWKPCASKLM